MSINDLTLSATFDEANGLIQLVADIGDGSPTETEHAFTLTRTDATGTTSVRQLEGQTSIAVAAGEYRITVPDHEHALAGLVTYTIRVYDETTNVWTASASLTVSTEREWLTFPILPQYSLELLSVGRYKGAWKPRAELMEIIDRDDPIPILRAFGTRAGSYGVIADTYADALAIADAIKRFRRAQLRLPSPVAASMYHTVTGIDIEQLDDTHRWLVVIEYTETASPTGYRKGTAGWSYGAATATGRTYADSTVLHSSYADRTAGDAA